MRARRGVYCSAELWHGTAGSPVRRHALEAYAGLVALRRKGWASHYSAALLNELPVPLREPRLVTLTVDDPAASRRSYPGLRLLTGSVAPEDTTTVWNIPVLTPARTSLDVARDAGFAAGLVLADASLRVGEDERNDLARIADVQRLWPYGDAVRLVAAHASATRESAVESKSFAAFVEAGLPLPACNAWVVGHGEGGARGDFVWRKHRVVGEADGRVKYEEPWGERDTVLVHEKERQSRIEEQGFVVVRWSGAEIEHRPDVVLERIVRYSRIASEMYGVPRLLPEAFAR